METTAAIAAKYIMHETSMICSQEFVTVHSHTYMKMIKTDYEHPHKLVKVNENEYGPSTYINK